MDGRVEACPKPVMSAAEVSFAATEIVRQCTSSPGSRVAGFVLAAALRRRGSALSA